MFFEPPLAPAGAVMDSSAILFWRGFFGVPTIIVLLFNLYKDLYVVRPEDSYTRSVARQVGEGLQTVGLMARAVPVQSGHQPAREVSAYAILRQRRNHIGPDMFGHRPASPYPRTPYAR